MDHRNIQTTIYVDVAMQFPSSLTEVNLALNKLITCIQDKCDRLVFFREKSAMFIKLESFFRLSAVIRSRLSPILLFSVGDIGDLFYFPVVQWCIFR